MKESIENRYQIFCQVGPRLIAHMDMDGTLTIRHDHFSDDENIELAKFIEALDKWHHRREIFHASKKGLNVKATQALNKLQEEKPGKDWLPPEKPRNRSLSLDNYDI